MTKQSTAPTPLDRAIRVALFTSGPSLEDGLRELLSKLEEHPQVDLVALFWETQGRSLGDSWRDMRKRRGALAPLLFALEAGRRARRWLHPLRERRLRRSLERLGHRIHVFADIHSDEALEQLRSLEPDLGLSYGSPILRPALFEIPSLGTLGIHHGKLPEYRGKKTPFWAILHGEPSVGVTIQRINARLDGGEIVREGMVEVGRAPLGPIWRRLEKLGVDLYLEAILEVREGRARFEAPRGTRGSLFRDPSPRDIVVFWLRWLRRLALGADRGRSS